VWHTISVVEVRKIRKPTSMGHQDTPRTQTVRKPLKIMSQAVALGSRRSSFHRRFNNFRTSNCCRLRSALSGMTSGGLRTLEEASQTKRPQTDNNHIEQRRHAKNNNIPASNGIASA
jgi:hypothetical protein